MILVIRGKLFLLYMDYDVTYLLCQVLHSWKILNLVLITVIQTKLTMIYFAKCCKHISRYKGTKRSTI